MDAAGRQFRTDLKLKIADVNETAANFSSMQLEDAVTMRFQAMEAWIEQLETELRAKRLQEESPRGPLLATATAEPSLLPRLPSALILPDELKTPAATRHRCRM